jgi:hypothetical protein
MKSRLQSLLSTACASVAAVFPREPQLKLLMLVTSVSALALAIGIYHSLPPQIEYSFEFHGPGMHWRTTW